VLFRSNMHEALTTVLPVLAVTMKMEKLRKNELVMRGVRQENGLEAMRVRRNVSPI